MALRSLYFFARPRKIFVVTSPLNIPFLREQLKCDLPVVFLDEGKLIKGVDLPSIRQYLAGRIRDCERAGWYFQQFLKMGMCFQDQVMDHYLVWDSDTIMLRPFSFFDPEGRPLVNTTRRFQKSYFQLTQELLGFSRSVDFSFISEHMVVKKAFMRQLIEEIDQKDKDRLWPFIILDHISDKNLFGTGFSEFETYGNFVHLNFAGSYGIRTLPSSRSGAKRTGPIPGRKDLFRMSGKYAYVSFEVWTRQIKWKRFTWKLGTFFYYGLFSLLGWFSGDTSLRLKAFGELSL